MARCLAVLPDGRWLVSAAGRTLHVWDLRSGECIATLKGHLDGVGSIVVSADGRWVASGGGRLDRTVRIWELELDWDYEIPEPVDWDDGARPYLQAFLTLDTPFGPNRVSREGEPSWTEDDFQQLLTELGFRGFGWLRPAGVRAKLAELAAGGV